MKRLILPCVFLAAVAVTLAAVKLREQPVPVGGAVVTVEVYASGDLVDACERAVAASKAAGAPVNFTFQYQDGLKVQSRVEPGTAPLTVAAYTQSVRGAN